ncbi:protein-tyrosine phosphatase family protein [Kutzneria viridogrisea]|uniref:Tyrosine specific protein phosphatases domain-containing protein n=2 Tax=Kutzneria TaxID=43356 RepID=W5W8U6_9PSEU|nr:protein-tyrosine phosphatase family protein [Kutzneria albida]AHH97135.1 hypothetical protein KALB_3771 [Kutzneria albida DSM 43870]MBA8931894.1 hypothetical protein [Kutzneria viridogrisea]
MSSTHLTGAIQLPDGAWIRGRGLRDPAPGDPSPEYGLYLGSHRLRARHDPVLRWPHDWLDWPDFLLPRDFQRAVELIHALHDRARSGARVEVCCGGGVGRTGTVIACLAVLSGLDPAAALTWTRAHHNPRAVETPWQRRWITRFAHA